MTRQCYRGRPRTSRRPVVSGDAGYIRSIAASCKRKSFGGCNLAQIATITMGMHARASRGGLFRRKPAAACGTRASRAHGVRNVQLAGSPAVASRPAEAARCFEVARKHPDARLPSEYARCGENFLRTKQAHTNTRPMPASGWMGATCSRPGTRSHPYRFTSRGRMRGVGATCTAPTTHGRPKRTAGPECCQIGAA